MALIFSGPSTTGALFVGSSNREYVVRVVLASPITIDGLALSVYYSNGPLPSAKIKAVIYNADGTPNPTTLFAAGDEVVGVFAGLLWLPFASSQTLAAGTYFWGFHTDTGFTANAAALTGYDRRTRIRTYTSGPIDPFGTPDASGTEGITIFATSGSGLAVAKGYELALLALPPGASVAKAYELALLAYPPGVSVAKAYDLLLLQDGSSAPPEPRPQGMIIT